MEKKERPLTANEARQLLAPAVEKLTEQELNLINEFIRDRSQRGLSHYTTHYIPIEMYRGIHDSLTNRGFKVAKVESTDSHYVVKILISWGR